LYMLKFETYEQTLSMMSLEISEKIKLGTVVKLALKPTHVAIAKDFQGLISYSNQIKCSIKSIENGKILTNIKLQFFDSILESIITLNSSQKMELKIGDEVIALIKASEISISEIIDV
jgi:molybdate transport system regulatory protein